MAAFLHSFTAVWISIYKSIASHIVHLCVFFPADHIWWQMFISDSHLTFAFMSLLFVSLHIVQFLLKPLMLFIASFRYNETNISRLQQGLSKQCPPKHANNFFFVEKKKIFFL